MTLSGQFINLNKKIIACKKCKRLKNFRETIAKKKRKQYINEKYWGKPITGFGDLNGKILLVGLAPAAHGGNRTGRVFTGDRSAEFLYKCLYKAKMSNQPTSENDARVVIKIVNQSDGSGATTVFGDVSAMAANSEGSSCVHLVLQRLWFSCDSGNGGDSYARLDEEDDDGDIPIIGLTGTGYWDFREFGGMKTDKSSNTNESDVNLVVPTTADAANMYTIVAEFKKLYSD